MTGSASVLASLLDSAMDVVSSGINALALIYATRPADDNHRFGHDKAESLAAYTQALLLLLSATAILYHAVGRLSGSEAAGLEQLGLGIELMGVVVVLTVALILFQKWVIQHTASALVAADSVHYRTDLLINMAVIGSLWLAERAPWLDAATAVVIAIYVYRAAWGILRQAVSELLDEELPEEQDRQLLSLAHAHSAVLGVHNLKTRRAGGRIFVQLHLEFRAQTPLATAHEAAQQAEHAILQYYPGAEVLIHMDPLPPAEPERPFRLS